MENRAHALAAGLFTLLLAAALVAAVIWFRKDNIRLTHYLVTTTHSVAGLRLEAPVQYRGVEVGQVEAIRIEPGVSGRINIRIGVQEDTPITQSTYAQLGYKGVTGLAHISLNDDGSSGEILKATGSEPPRISMRPSLFDSGLDLLTAVNDLTGRMNDLLNPENRRLVSRTLAGIEQASRKTAALAEKMESGVQNLPALVGEAREAVAKTDKLMASLNATSGKPGERAGALDRIVGSAEEVGNAARSVNEETLPRLNALIEQLNREARALDRVLKALDERPQSFVFGAPRGKPGPGEPGFSDGAR